MFHSPSREMDQGRAYLEKIYLTFIENEVQQSPTKHYKLDTHYDIPSDVCFASKNQPKKAEICAGYICLLLSEPGTTTA